VVLENQCTSGYQLDDLGLQAGTFCEDSCEATVAGDVSFRPLRVFRSRDAVYVVICFLFLLSCVDKSQSGGRLPDLLISPAGYISVTNPSVSALVEASPLTDEVVGSVIEFERESSPAIASALKGALIVDKVVSCLYKSNVFAARVLLSTEKKALAVATAFEPSRLWSKSFRKCMLRALLNAVFVVPLHSSWCVKSNSGSYFGNPVYYAIVAYGDDSQLCDAQEAQFLAETSAHP
jgi:hypothetical protein